MDIAQSRPRFRTDLVAQPIDEAGQRFVDVTDPNSGKTFRFYEVEYSIACSMNGQRDLAGLLDWAQAELGLQPSREELETVINTLAELGYLEDASSSAGYAADLDQFDLGQAGFSGGSEEEELPPSADVELGSAGVGAAPSSDEETFVAPSLSLGQAGNEEAPAGAPEAKGKSEQSFAGLMDDDEDHVPTTIKRPGQVTGARPPSEVPPAAPPQATLRPVGAIPDDDEDGPTNLPPPKPPDFDDEVSVDLSDHLQLGPDAVKEAVRQSQLMQTVEPDQVEEESAASAASEARAAAPPLPTPPVPKPEQSRGADEPQPVELPDKPASVSKPVEPVAEPMVAQKSAPKGGSSRTGLLVLVLLLALVAAAGAAVYLDLFGIKGRLGLDKNTQPAPEPAEVEPVAEEPEPKKPELPAATLELGEAPVVEVKAEQRGRIATIVESGTEVQEGDVVIKLRGAESIERKIESYNSREEHYQAKLERALEKAGEDSSAAKSARRKVKEKQELAAAEEEKLQAFLIKAPAAGTVETSLGEGDSFSEGDLLFGVTGAPMLTATFTVPDDSDYSEDGEVEVVSKADDKKRGDCKITEVDGPSVTVECSTDGDVTADDEVLLAP